MHCEYEGCKEEVYQDNLCILHVDFTMEDIYDEFTEINLLKELKVKEKVNDRDFNFAGAKLRFVNFSNEVIENKLDFNHSKIKCINCSGAIIHSANFSGAAIDNANFNDVTMEFGDFSGATINQDAWFRGTTIKNEAIFSRANIEFAFFKGANMDYANFSGVNIGYAGFSGASMEIADFNGATIKYAFRILTADIKERFCLKGAIFPNLESEEEAYRKVKQVNEHLGVKSESDKYFYKEMVVKRKQKSWYLKYPELIVQYCFGYGVHPWRVMITWIIMILAFAGIYLTQNWNYSDFLTYSYSSVVTAITPGFGNYHPAGWYQLVASIEAIIGTFMWATFIATFARKYMR